MGLSSSSAAGCSGLDVAALGAAEMSWWATVLLGGKLYAAPCHGDRLLIYDPTVAGDSGPAVTGSRLAVSGLGKWRSAVALGSRIYGVPDRAEQMLVFDVKSGAASFVNTRPIAAGPYKWQGAAALGGKVYGIPHNAEKLLVYDPDSGKASGIPTVDVARGPAKWLATTTLGSKLYGLPCDAAALLIYDAAVGRLSGVDVSHLCPPDRSFKWLAAVAVGGKVYGIPCHADCILVFDPLTGEASAVDTTAVATGPGKWTSVVVHSGVLYGIPDHADAVLVYNTRTGSVSGIDVAHVATGPAKWQGGAMLAGKVYAAPHNADQLLIFDPATASASGVDVGHIASGAGKWGLTVALGGNIVGVPCNAKQLLLYTPEAGSEVPPPPALEAAAAGDEAGAAEPPALELVADLPADLPQDLVEDFTAAWLSGWVYNVTEPTRPCPVPSLQVGGNELAFQVLTVYEEPMQGSPARLALVTAQLPKGCKVLYFVFKGTSLLADLVANASLSPDYAPFHRAFDDTTTFIHSGAYHAIAQLRVHQRAAFTAAIAKAAEEGVQKLVVTGHSLGGQYAMAFLCDIFLDASTPQGGGPSSAAQPPLLAAARCVTFGSPMAFGSAEGHEVRDDLRAFFGQRSMNYITAGDPAPRLWSELDLEEFVRYFAERLRQRIPSAVRVVVDWAAGPGGLAQRAEELMERPDVEAHLMRPARQYRHISPLRMLSDGFRDWRPFGQQEVVLEQHGVQEGYIQGFLNAMDSANPLSLYDERGNQLL